MGLDAILALGEELAGLVNSLIAAKNARDQAAFNTAWVAMQTKLAASNLAWEMAGTPPSVTG